MRCTAVYPALLLIALLLPLAAGCTSQQDPTVLPVGYADSVAAWRQQRVEGLRTPDSWLSLVGLYWLGEGAYTFGSDSSNALITPKGPAQIGTFTLQDGVVHFQAAPGVTVTHDGDAVASRALATDADGPPDVLAWGPLRWHVIDRDGRLAVRLKDAESPARTAFQGIETYPIDPAWRLVGRFEPYDPPRTLPIPTIQGTPSDQPSPGAVVFEFDGATHRLDVTGEPDDPEYFLMFADSTNGRETYGAGRYLYILAPGKSGVVVIDFNKAYNPPCVFTPYATCPFPPPQNRLPFAVTAGEKHYGKAM